MKKDELLKVWLHEQEIAHIHGWDFSHINGRYQEGDDLPWNYEKIVRTYLKPGMRLLDLDTGGGEFLLSLNHPHHLLAATENYEPNVLLCREKLLPLGIDFKMADAKEDKLPYDNQSFDIVINRHGDFNPKEIYRVLKPNGIFITQQVGAQNDRELVELLLEDAPPIPFPEQYLENIKKSFQQVGFTIEQGEECYRPIKFWDVGALVWFARIIEWEFPNFEVTKCLDNLYRAQEILEHNGTIEGRIHRFLLVARKE